MVKKILLVTGGWGNGGIENLIACYCKHISNSKLQLDVFTFYKSESIYTKVVEECGGIILSPACNIEGNYITKNVKIAKSFIKVARDYDIIHYNTAFALAYLHCFFLKLVNPTIKIVLHSHGDSLNPPYVYLKSLFHRAIKSLFYHVVNEALACSTSSGEWLFCVKLVKSPHFSVIKNATGLDKFKFDLQARKRIRCEHKIGEKKLIGTIGRIEYQKNPFFIVNTIDSLRTIDNNFSFIWIGYGINMLEIKREISTRQLDRYVIFVEKTDRVSDYLSAMDIFILPSRYEGLGIVLLEAQANGLKCYTSDTTPLESKISNKIHYLPILDGDEVKWAELIKDTKVNYERIYPEKEIVKNGYDVKIITEQLTTIYNRL